MGQGKRPAAVRRSPGSARTQSLSRRIHRAHRVELSAAGRRQGAAAVSADFYRGGKVRLRRQRHVASRSLDIAEAFEKVARAGQRVMKELLWFAQPQTFDLP